MLKIIKDKIENLSQIVLPIILIGLVVIGLSINASNNNNPNAAKVFINGNMICNPVIQVIKIPIYSPSEVLNIKYLGFKSVGSVSATGVACSVSSFSTTEVELEITEKNIDNKYITLTIIGN